MRYTNLRLLTYFTYLERRAVSFSEILVSNTVGHCNPVGHVSAEKWN